ncbi:hypothetical protein L6164_001137 [Bauhinia variegata]|uniref:Uncharacterized protein n=1 Tax=Bauhinia variegata TaxID=167791 RepID=A0ACB9Q8T2_BAUVA|nr:hypothetical protein L6164_001137 [Bauhinia variegata]
MADSKVYEDPYRTFLQGDSEKDTKWKYGYPNYEVVNKLFEAERTNVWAPGTIEYEVQGLVKNWEMEVLNKADVNQYRSIDPTKFSFWVNGKSTNGAGGYNGTLQTSLPEKYRIYNPDEETTESSLKIFNSVFNRGFALEILQVYSGPPVIVYKFRHWGYMESPYKGHAATGELIQFICIGIFTLENEKIVKAEFFFDPADVLTGLIKGPELDAASSCPFGKLA